MPALIRSLAASLFLLCLKVSVGLWTHSLSLLAEAVHSLLDILSIGFGMWAIEKRQEKMALLAEACILAIGVVWVIMELNQRHIHTITATWPGILVSAISIITYTITFKENHKEHQHSEAVLANLYHLASDIGASVVVLFGLVFVQATGLAIFDTVSTYIIAMWLVYLIILLLRKAFS